MDTLKILMEKRAAKVAEMEEANGKKEFETFETLEEELREIDREIAAEKRMIELRQEKAKTQRSEDDEAIKCEIREAIESGKEVDLTEIEVRANIMGPNNGDNKTVGNIAKATFADYILKKLPYISPLYNAVRKEMLGSANHAIPVQKNKIGKFVKMSELQNYVAQNAEYNQIKLEPKKFGTMVQFSEEVVEDLGYNLEADLLEQLVESYGITLDELIVTGDNANNIDGLDSFAAADGATEITQATANKITSKEILDIYYGLPIQYRKNATWVISDSMARELAKLEFADGQPVLFTGFGVTPVDQGTTILGRPVIINNHVKPMGNANNKSIFFADLTKCLVIGPRRSLVIKRNEEFINDSIMIKANVRFDIKKALGEAMVLYKCK